MSQIWVPGTAPQSLDDFVERIHRQIEQYTQTHPAEKSEVEVELANGERVTLQSLSAEPGYGFVTLTAHAADGGDVKQLIVPVGAIRRIALGPAHGERVQFGFSLPDEPDQRKRTEPAA